MPVVAAVVSWVAVLALVAQAAVGNDHVGVLYALAVAFDIPSELSIEMYEVRIECEGLEASKQCVRRGQGV